MPPNNEMIAALREALRVSPDNLPLRQALADALMDFGFNAEAEAEYRAALAIAPNSAKLKTGLATVFHRLGKNSEALVLVEELIAGGGAPPKVLLLFAKILLARRQIAKAAIQYNLAVEADPSLVDSELAGRLGISAVPVRQPDNAPPNFLQNLLAGRRRLDQPEDSPSRAEVERPKVTFADVGGMETVKEDIRIKIIHPLTHADLYKAYGKAIGGGILMYGPPGCGKTHLARATAGEIHASFIAVGITDVLDMWIGSSERNLHEIFDQARRRRPCVLFFDEADALAASRTDRRVHAGRNVINQFLSEMDGVSASNEGILMLAATNAPWHVDPAFRRPGRFDSILFVPPPDAEARAAILRIHLQGKPVGDVDHADIAAKTEGYSGADIKALVNSAIDAKLREAMKSGVPTPLSTADFLEAIARVKPSTHEWFAAARNYAMYSNQSGTYDSVLKYLKM
jgi:AAA+ superfamily predicted ATPase